MATKTAAANTQTENKEVVINDMNDDDLLKIEQEMKAKLAEIAEAKKVRADGMKKQAFTEIGAAIKKYFDSVVNQGELTDFLEAEGYIPVAKVVTPSGAGRRKINDEDVLFYRKYKNEGGDREMSLKLDANSKMPVPASGAYKELKRLASVDYAELKKSFNAKFFEFAATPEGQKWVKTFFPHIVEDMAGEVETKEEVKEPAAA